MPSNHLFVFQGAHYVVKPQDDNVLRHLLAEECYAITARWKRLNPAAGLNCVIYSAACLSHSVFSHIQGCLSESHKEQKSAHLLCKAFRGKLHVALTSGDNGKVKYC